MINAILGEQKTQIENSFPKLMIGVNHLIIVLMLEPKIGIVINPNEYYEIGHKSNSFVMESFTDYNGPITLQNA